MNIKALMNPQLHNFCSKLDATISILMVFIYVLMVMGIIRHENSPCTIKTGSHSELRYFPSGGPYATIQTCQIAVKLFLVLLIQSSSVLILAI